MYPGLLMSAWRYLSLRMGRSKYPFSRSVEEPLLMMPRVEIAVKQILCGMNVKTSASVANAECLDWYKQWAIDHP